MLSVNDYRILAASLRFAWDQIEEAERYLSAVTPRTAELSEHLARFASIRRMIDDERREVAANLQAAGEAGETEAGQLALFDGGNEHER
jgi:hypothetical protein